MFRRALAPASALVLLSVACQPPSEPQPNLPDPTPSASADQIDLTEHVADAWSVEAVALDGDTILTLLPGRGLLRTDLQGNFVDLLLFGEESGLPDLGYGDLDVLPDGRLVLAAPNEAVAFDPDTGVLDSYFCLEPGFGEVVMENRALTVDHEGGRIFGAPTYYDTSVSWSDPSSAFHVQYALDGTFIRDADVLTTGIVAEGLVMSNDLLFAVDGSQLAAFDDEGRVRDLWTLEGVEDASGLSVDQEGRFLVSDRADLEVRAFEIDLEGM